MNISYLYRINKLVEQKYSVASLHDFPVNGYKIGPMRVRAMGELLRGFGNFCVLSGDGLLGAFSMRSVIFTPLQKDAPLLSIDTVSVFGKTMLMLELYDTLVDTASCSEEALSGLLNCKKMAECLPDKDNSPHWYDYLLLSPTITKKVARKDLARMDAVIDAYVDAYLALVDQAPVVDKEAKCARTAEYVNGLFEKGGPSTDQFVKAIGEEQARELFFSSIFAISCPSHSDVE